jgi:hypothetical protein
MIEAPGFLEMSVILYQNTRRHIHETLIFQGIVVGDSALYPWSKAAPKGGGLPGCSPRNPKKLILKTKGFLDVTMSEVSLYLPFTRSLPLH